MQQNKSRTPWIVCGVIALLVVCGAVVLLVGGFGVLAWFGGQTEASLGIQIESPSSVQAGQTFDLAVTVSNQGDAAVTVDTITLPIDLLDSAEVVQVNPQPSTSAGGSYSMTLIIDPGQSSSVVFTLKALKGADVSGEIKASAGESSAGVGLELAIEQTQVDAQPTKAVSNNTNPPSNGEIAGIPYKAVVQILAIVKMENGEFSPGWSGSGSIISPDGLVLTNAHVVLSDRYYTVEYLVIAMTNQPDALPEPKYVAEMMQVDATLDIAVIRIKTDLDGNPVDPASLNLPTVPMGDDTALQLGDALTILGYPSIGGSTITLTRGEVAGFTAQEAYGNRAFIKTSATISGGNSGGLAANAQGQIIGIPTQLGYGGDDQYVDCRVLADTNRDGVVDEKDNCVPTGGFINALRPLALAKPLIDAAARGEIDIKEGHEPKKGSLPEENNSKVLFSDDFSDPNSGWDDSSWDEGAVHYVDGEYQMTVIPEKWLSWSYLGDEYDNVVVSVDARVVQPTGVGDFGLMLRFVDDENFYAFEVSEDGYFTIWKEVAGEYVTLYDWEYSDAIPTSGSFTLNTAAVGNHLLIGVNDVLLADITDDSFTSGRVGLLAGTLDSGGLIVGFDNFVIQEP